MKGSIFEVVCPCCGARLELDGEAGVLLSHEPPRSAKRPKNLDDAVRKMRAEDEERETLFDRKVAEHTSRGGDLDKRFEALLKKQKGKPATRPDFRDFDFD